MHCHLETAIIILSWVSICHDLLKLVNVHLTSFCRLSGLD